MYAALSVTTHSSGRGPCKLLTPCTQPTHAGAPPTWSQVGEVCPDGPTEVSCSSGLFSVSLSLLKYFLGGGFGLEDVGFRTKISKDFFRLSGGWVSWSSQTGGLSSGGLGAAEGSSPGSGPRGTLGLCVLTSTSQGGCSPPLLGLPPGDPDMSLLERIMTF